AVTSHHSDSFPSASPWARLAELAVLVPSVIALSGCGDLAVQDPRSLLLPAFTRSEVVGFVAGFGTTFAALPDLLGILKRRSSAGMNPRMAAIMCVFQVLWIWYGLLIGAELIVHQRLRFVASQFRQRRLVPEDARPRFDQALASTVRLRNSVLAEVAIIVFIYVVGLRLARSQHAALDVATWFAKSDGTLSPAGVWYVYFSLPVTQFLLLRWYYRLFIWTRFLWKVSRIDLRLVPTHPDHLGGLGFLSTATAAFAPLAVAHGAFVSAWIGTRIFFLHAALPDFKN